jgi:hypothetical protein
VSTCRADVASGRVLRAGHHRNRRRDYLEAFLDHLVNWEYVAKMLDAGMNKVSHAA